MVELIAHTDGACSGNPGPGGWGVLLEARQDGVVVKERALSGGEAETTNNRMELMAAIQALEVLERPAAITIVTDSAYVKNGVTGWIHGWKKNGWKTAAKKPVKNAELWQRLDAARARREQPCRPQREVRLVDGEAARVDRTREAHREALRRCGGHLRTGRKNGLAHAPVRPDADRHPGRGPGAARRRPGRGNPSR